MTGRIIWETSPTSIGNIPVALRSRDEHSFSGRGTYARSCNRQGMTVATWTISALKIVAALAAFGIGIPLVVALASFSQAYAALIVAAIAGFVGYRFVWFGSAAPARRVVGMFALFYTAFCLLTFALVRDEGPWKLRTVEQAAEYKRKTEAEREAQLEKERAWAEKARAESERASAEAKERAEREAEDKAERDRREAARLAGLRKSNPDEYLALIKTSRPQIWVDELKVLRPKEYAAYQAQEAREREDRMRAFQRSNPKDYLTLSHSWRAGGFGSVMLADFTVKSTLLFAVKDIVVRCIGYGNSGTAISEHSAVLYDVVPANATKRISGVNLGFMSSQTATAGCQIVRATPL